MWFTQFSGCFNVIFSYGIGILAPNIVDPGIKNYQCAHNLIIAHGKAYRMYEEEFKERQQGILKICKFIKKFLISQNQKTIFTAFSSF